VTLLSRSVEDVSMTYKLTLAVVGAAVLAVTACTSQLPKGGAPMQRTTSTAAPSPSRATASPMPASKSLAVLTCDDGERSGAAEPKRGVSGVSSSVWGAQAPVSLAASREFSFGGMTFIKSPLYVSSTVERGTVVRVVSPKTARLFYTSFAVWTEPEGLATTDLISTARRDVQIQGCPGDSAEMYPGGFVVAGPSCVLIEVAGHNAHRHIVKAPLGKPCP